MQSPNSRLPDSLDSLFTSTKPKSPETSEIPENRKIKPKPVFLPGPGAAEISSIPETPEIAITAASLDKLTIPITPEMFERIYSEVYHDEKRRWLWIVVSEILAEGLANRSKKPPAPPEWIAQHKVKGKNRKS